MRNRRDQLTCMVTGVAANRCDAQARHIIGVKHRHCASALQTDVMCACNGILWLSVLEDAWSKRQFCFTCRPGEQCVRFTLLDDNLQNMRLVDHPGAVELQRDTKTALDDVTFGQLIDRPLLEPVTADKRPYRRALCFLTRAQKACKQLLK